MGIRDKPTAPASPWENGFAERLIGSIRRECVDHIIVLGEAHLRQILKSYARYYNETRTHIAWISMRPFFARFREPVWSGHLPSWADFITTTSGYRFSVHTTSDELRLHNRSWVRPASCHPRFRKTDKERSNYRLASRLLSQRHFHRVSISKSSGLREHQGCQRRDVVSVATGEAEREWIAKRI
jgi:hypothetical protein